MANAINPYGDGLSAHRTIKILKNFFGFADEVVEEFIPK
jgi:UDP-N-acetylglucosamine 2-epimerase